MALRKSFSGDRETAFKYLGLAQARLADLKQLMQLGGLQQLMRTISLPGGVQVQVASVMGQDYISIDVPLVPVGAAPAPMATAKEAEQAAVATEYEAGEIAAALRKTFADTVYSSGSCAIEMTQIPTPRIYIGGAQYDRGGGLSTNRYYPVYWSNTFGFYRLGLRESYGERAGYVFSLSANGTYPAGSVFIYDSVINPATINPFTGGGGTPYGEIEVAAVWRSGAHFEGDADIMGWNQSNPTWSRVYSTDTGGGNARGPIGTGGGFLWDGRAGHGHSSSSVPTQMGKTSANGRVVVDGYTYRLDGGLTYAWGDSDCYANCVVCIQDPTTTTTIVISG